MTASLAILSDRGVLRVSGADATNFLQGLLTNDVENLAVGAARYAALLTPQGKVLFDFLVVREETAFLLDCPADLTAALAKRLGFYRLRAKVTIDDASAELAVAASLDGMVAPGQGWLSFADPRDARLGFRIIAPRAALADKAAAVDYEARRIALGIPKGGIDFAYGDIFPHDANMDLLHGLDFEKGCYVGQEVVSRMRHRAALRKRVVRVRVIGQAPAPGTPVLDGELNVGTIGSAAGGIALAQMRLDRIEDARAAGRGLSAGGVTVIAIEAQPSLAEVEFSGALSPP
jgi:folate-binding protein YgfZ